MPRWPGVQAVSLPVPGRSSAARCVLYRTRRLASDHCLARGARPLSGSIDRGDSDAAHRQSRMHLPLVSYCTHGVHSLLLSAGQCRIYGDPALKTQRSWAIFAP